MCSTNYLKESIIQIQILSNTTVAHPTKTPGKTTPKLDLAFKNLTYQGKIEGKSLFSFGAQEGAYKALVSANPGDIFEIEVVKNTQGFNDWVSAKKSDGGVSASPAASGQTGTSSAKPAYATAPKSTYPTEDERAKTQIYIVRQATLNAANATLAVGAKSVKPEDVIKVAKQYEDHVFGTSNEPVVTPVAANPASAFDDLDDMPQ